MTDTRRPPACHYDRHQGHRVTRHHRDDCTNPTTHPGCAPCTAPHCHLCGHRHLDNDHPTTCDHCLHAVRTDLADILWSCRHLRWQAVRAGRDGRLAAAKPIPGGDAMVLIARAGATADDLVWSKTLDDDHKPHDPIPPLLPLAAWDTIWRTWFGHAPAVAPSVSGIVHYLSEHLTAMARTTDGPDWRGFARDIADLRRTLERTLHDEREPEQGVSCFECGDRLVRKFGTPKPCRHVAEADKAGVTVTQWVYTLSTYPELRDDHGLCRDQGGIANPEAGQSWECIGCRKAYTPGEYANAVRRDLLEGGPDGDGWTHVAMAAEAASTMTGHIIPASTVRKWMDRGKVASLCRWSAGSGWGLRLVFWPDVADAAADAVERAIAAEVERRRRAEQRDRLAAAIIAEGVTARSEMLQLGKGLEIHPARVEALLDEIEREGAEAS